MTFMLLKPQFRQLGLRPEYLPLSLPLGEILKSLDATSFRRRKVTKTTTNVAIILSVRLDCYVYCSNAKSRHRQANDITVCMAELSSTGVSIKYLTKYCEAYHLLKEYCTVLD